MISRYVEETEAFGEKLARLLRSGDVVWLYGGLGAGKTAFTRGLARGLDVEGRVTSPTYAIMNEYTGTLPLFHYDAYRLTGIEDLRDTGWDELDSGVRVVEWAERVGGEAAGICVMISAPNETEREIEVCFLP